MKTLKLTQSMAFRTMEMATPSIKKILEMNPSHNVVYVAIPDPIAPTQQYKTLWEGAIGEQDKTLWGDHWDELTREKTKIILRTGISCRFIQDQSMWNKGIKLNPREIEVLQLAAQGFSNKQIADKFGIGIKTVEKHREHFSEKTGIRGLVALTHYALDIGLVRNNTEPVIGVGGLTSRLDSIVASMIAGILGSMPHF